MEVTIRIPTIGELARHWRWTLLALLAALIMVWPGAGRVSAVGSIQAPDTGGNVGLFSSLALDGSGRPVVSYLDATNSDLKLLHCNDANCAGLNESITAPDAVSVAVGTSLALDGSGYPVVSYYNLQPGDLSELKVLHCNDANCAVGGDTISTPDSGLGGVPVGTQYTSLALDASGRPVVSYWDGTSTDQNLKVLHCDDANCMGNESANIETPDTTNNVGQYSSLVLDTAGPGNPVISYYDVTSGNLKVLHCDDANCAGNESANTESPDTTDNVGQYTSLTLDVSGNPVVSYYNVTNGYLKVLHCNDANCAGNESANTESPDTSANVGSFTSLALDAAVPRHPVVSYYDVTNGRLKVLHCNDANCAGGDESITAPDTAGDVGSFTSLALDGSGRPVVSYYDPTSSKQDLRVLHCANANCSSTLKPKISIKNLEQLALPKTCFQVRGSSQVPLFTVCDNDFQGAAESNAICLPDGVCNDEDPEQGAVSVTVSSADYLVAETTVAPNHTAITGKQACDATSGTCSVTFLNTPNTRPWHPWDLNNDGIVRTLDITAVVNHYGQDKP